MPCLSVLRIHHRIGQQFQPCQFQEKFQHNSTEVHDSPFLEAGLLRDRGGNNIPIHGSGQEQGRSNKGRGLSSKYAIDKQVYFM